MATDLLTDLERLGDLLQRISDPITLDQIREHPAVSLDQPPVDIEAEVGVAPATDEIGLVALYRSMTDHASRRRVVAAMVAAAAVVGALWLATWRSGAETGVGDPIQETTAVSPVPGVADGRVTFDAVPAGWRLNGASDAPGSAGSDAFVQRIYATADPAPENQPALVLTSFAEGAGPPNVADSAESLSVQGVDGHMFPSAGGGQSLVFGPVDGFRYLLIGYHVSRAELVAAANTVHPSPDGYGAVIASDALPPEVSEKGAGFVSEIWFVSRAAAAHSVSEAHWTNGTGYLWYRSFADPDLSRLGRFGFDSVIDITVQGHPAYLATAQQGTVVSIMWSDGARTFLLASSGGLNANELQATAESMRPVTEAQWADMTVARATIQPTDTTTVESIAAGPPPRLLPTWLPDGLVVWNIETLPTSISVNLRSLDRATATRPAETEWSVTPSSGAFDPAITNLEHITFDDGTVAYYELNDTSQWLHWKTPDGYEVTMSNNRLTLSREDFEHVARSLKSVDAAALAAAQATIAQMIHTQLVSVRAGDIGSIHLEVFGFDANTAAAICITGAGAPEECQTAIGDVATVIANNGTLLNFRFPRPDRSIDAYGWISPNPTGFDYPPGITLESSDNPNGTWVHVHSNASQDQPEVTVHLPDGSSFGMGI